MRCRLLVLSGTCGGHLVRPPNPSVRRIVRNATVFPKVLRVSNLNPPTAFAGTASHYTAYRPPYPDEFLSDLLSRAKILGMVCCSSSLADPAAWRSRWRHISTACSLLMSKPK